MIFTPKHTNSHFFWHHLKILTPALLVVLVTNIRYTLIVVTQHMDWILTVPKWGQV